MNQPGVESTSRAAQVMNVDTDSKLFREQSKVESEIKTPYSNQRGKMSSHDSSEMQKVTSLLTYV